MPEPIDQQITPQNTDVLLENILESHNEASQETNQLLSVIAEQAADESTEQLLQNSLEVQSDMLEEMKKTSATKVTVEGLDVITIKGPKGEDGKTPEKGKDYYTPEEITKLVKEISDAIRVPEDGKTPVKGVDYFTEEEIAGIVDEVFSKIEIPKDGEDGKDAVVDYEFVISEVMAKLPNLKGEPGRPGKDGNIITAEQILSKIKGMLSYNDLKDVPTAFKERMKGTGYLYEITDVEILNANNDEVLQFDLQKKKWKNGIAITVSDTAPTNPKINDLWIDIS